MLTDRQPYKWQERLLYRWFTANRIPGVVDIPTGLGKTAMGLWPSAVAVGAKLPRRLIYVVDRRTVTLSASCSPSATSTTGP
jgi:CRISPR-associated endonuclease/helicase Cas3